MNLARLEKLKHIVATCKDLTTAFDYFMDHFGENDEFLDLGKPKPHPFLQKLISTVGGQMFGANVVVASLLLIKVPGTQFIHGAGRLNRLPVTVIYFDDIKVGIMAVMQGPTGPTQLSRFSAQMLPPEAAPSEN